jgi:hypothetical protein
MKNTDNIDFESWLSRVTKNVPEPEVSPEFLAEQRRCIYRRLDSPSRNWISTRSWISITWSLSLAMLFLMLAGGLTLGRRHKTAPAISDEQLFSDLSAMEQDNEPKAIQPIHGLFQQ